MQLSARFSARGVRAQVFALGACLASACSSQPSGDDLANGGTFGFGGAAGTGGSGGAMGGSSSTQGGSGGSMGGAAGQGGAGGAGGGAGTGGSAGSGGAAGSGGMGMTVEVCPAGTLFCDDFEDDMVGQAPGSPWRDSTSSGGIVTVGTEQAFSGTRAVHASAPTGANYRRAYFALDQGSSSNIFPGAAQEMYGRAMMWLEETPDTAIHWTFVQGEGAATTPSAHNRLYRYGGQQQGGAGLMANFETTMLSTDCWQHSQRTMPEGTWTCVEWRFAVATNEMQFWLDGAEIQDLHVTGAGEGCIGNALNGQWLAPPAFQSLYLGWEHYQQPGNDIDLWIDAVVVSTERVGCPAE